MTEVPGDEGLTAPFPRSAFIRSATVGRLLRTYGEVLDELRARGVLRTGNSPLGDYAERLFAGAFGWELSGNSAAGYDALDGETRYQIKARRLATRRASRQLSALRKLPEKPFDILAAVLFHSDFTVLRAALIPHDVVVNIARRTEHTNSWRLMLTDAVWDLAGVEDVTERLREVAAQDA